MTCKKPLRIPDSTAVMKCKLQSTNVLQTRDTCVIAQSANGKYAISIALIAVNKEDAKGSWCQAGWRPAVGWVCVA